MTLRSAEYASLPVAIQLSPEWASLLGALEALWFAGARVRRTTAQTIGDAAWTALQWAETTSFEEGDVWQSGANTRLTAPKPGVYFVQAVVRFAANSTGVRGLRVQEGGATVIGTVQQNSAGASEATYLQLALPYALDKDDYVEIEVFQDSGGNLDIEASGHESPWAALLML